MKVEYGSYVIADVERVQHELVEEIERTGDLQRDLDAARARIAEVERERDQAHGSWNAARVACLRAESSVARLREALVRISKGAIPARDVYAFAKAALEGK